VSDRQARSAIVSPGVEITVRYCRGTASRAPADSAGRCQNRRPAALPFESFSPFLCVSVSLWLMVLVFAFLRALRALRG
jgi:hypothetical protein